MSKNHYVFSLMTLIVLGFSPLTNAATLVKNSQINQHISPKTTAQVTSISQFSDVSPNDYYYKDLQALVENFGIIAGYPDNTFRAENNLTRYEFVGYLSGALQIFSQFDIFLTQPVVEIAPVVSINDVAPTDWTFQAIVNLVERYGVSLLDSNNMFRGTQAITYQELTTYLNQALGLELTTDQGNQPVSRGDFVVILNQAINQVAVNELGSEFIQP